MHTARAYGDWLEVDYRVRRWRTQRESLISELETGIIMTHLNLPQQKAAGVSHRRQPDPCREIRQLCQHMMDYLSAGHFALYTLLLHEGAQLTRRAHHLISTIYHRIEHSTDEAICFNDKYDADEASVLGEP